MLSSNIHQSFCELAALLAGMPRFGPPRPRSWASRGGTSTAVAGPPENIVAAQAVFAAVTNRESPFQLATLRRLIGHALLHAPHADDMRECWQQVERTLDGAAKFVAGLPVDDREKFVAKNAVTADVLAGFAHALSVAITCLEIEIAPLAHHEDFLLPEHPGVDPTTPAPQLVSIREAAETLGVKANLIRSGIKNKSIPAYKFGRRWMVNVAEVRRAASIKPTPQMPTTETPPGEPIRIGDIEVNLYSKRRGTKR